MKSKIKITDNEIIIEVEKETPVDEATDVLDVKCDLMKIQ